MFADVSYDLVALIVLVYSMYMKHWRLVWINNNRNHKINV